MFQLLLLLELEGSTWQFQTISWLHSKIQMSYWSEIHSRSSASFITVGRSRPFKRKDIQVHSHLWLLLACCYLSMLLHSLRCRGLRRTCDVLRGFCCVRDVLWEMMVFDTIFQRSYLFRTGKVGSALSLCLQKWTTRAALLKTGSLGLLSCYV